MRQLKLTKEVANFLQLVVFVNVNAMKEFVKILILWIVEKKENIVLNLVEIILINF